MSDKEPWLENITNIWDLLLIFQQQNFADRKVVYVSWAAVKIIIINYVLMCLLCLL